METFKLSIYWKNGNGKKTPMFFLNSQRGRQLGKVNGAKQTCCISDQLREFFLICQMGSTLLWKAAVILNEVTNEPMSRE